jgi:hypothetical protein
MRVEDVVGRNTEDVVAAKDDAEVAVEGVGEGGREVEGGGTSEDDLATVGEANEEELVCDDVLAELETVVAGSPPLDMSAKTKK